MGSLSPLSEPDAIRPPGSNKKEPFQRKVQPNSTAYRRRMSDDTASHLDSQCWICLEPVMDGSSKLCKCPGFEHPECRARWQLHRAGTSEEVFCRFCKSKLPDWKERLLPPDMPSCKDLTAALMPTMGVTYQGVVHHVQVDNSEGGLERFTNRIREIFGISEDNEMQLAFDCSDPLTGKLVKLNGAGAFAAAVHCATVSAAKRLQHGPEDMLEHQASNSKMLMDVLRESERLPFDVLRESERLQFDTSMPSCPSKHPAVLVMSTANAADQQGSPTEPPQGSGQDPELPLLVSGKLRNFRKASRRRELCRRGSNDLGNMQPLFIRPAPSPSGRRRVACEGQGGRTDGHQCCVAPDTFEEPAYHLTPEDLVRPLKKRAFDSGANAQGA
eukprot:jgi/Botrbrau1/19504/Bobra.0035s0005.1